MSLSCSICYEDIKETCKIDSCNHPFCISCITKWGKTTNTCPCCRQKFNVLYHANNNSLIDYFVDKENNDYLSIDRFTDYQMYGNNCCLFVVYLLVGRICARKIPQLTLNRKLKGSNKYMDMAHYQRIISV
jgi:hypothetical protein